jgi:hypothetical protein
VVVHLLNQLEIDEFYFKKYFLNGQKGP